MTSVVERFSGVSDLPDWLPGTRPGDSIAFSCSSTIDLIGVGVYLGGEEGSKCEVHVVVLEGVNASKGTPLRESRCTLESPGQGLGEKTKEGTIVYLSSSLELSADIKYCIVVNIQGLANLASSRTMLDH